MAFQEHLRVGQSQQPQSSHEPGAGNEAGPVRLYDLVLH